MKWQVEQLDRRLATLLVVGFDKVCSFNTFFVPLNVMLQAQIATRSIQEAVESGGKHQAEREAMQEEYDALRSRLDSVRELFR